MDDVPLICVVDDDGAVRESLAALLRSCGYRVGQFDSAEGFLASENCTATDCVISDVELGVSRMSGIDLVVALAERMRVPIILVSGSTDASLRARATSMGVRDVLDKPFDPERLVSAIAVAIDRAPKLSARPAAPLMSPGNAQPE